MRPSLDSARSAEVGGAMKERGGDGAETGRRYAEMVCVVSRTGGGEQGGGVGGAELGGGRGEFGGERRKGFFDNRCTFFQNRGRARAGGPSLLPFLYIVEETL